MNNLIGIFANCGECGQNYAVFVQQESLTHRCPSCGVENGNCDEWYALGERVAMPIKPQAIIDEMEKQKDLVRNSM